DLIVLDTFERLGRTDDLLALRHELRTRHGVLIVTADTGFADPTTAVGQLTASFEAVRATEENRVKAHNVLRGKINTALQGYWPGGPAPLGFKLELALVEQRGRRQVVRHHLVPDEGTAWIARRLFDLALRTGHGGSRLAQAMNEDPDVPGRYKPFHTGTVLKWLKSTLYIGTLTFNRRSSGIVDDKRI